MRRKIGTTMFGCLYLQLFVWDTCLIYVICVCLRIVVSNTYCVVFLFCFSSSCVPYVASFSGLSIFSLPLRYSPTFIYKIKKIFVIAWVIQRNG